MQKGFVMRKPVRLISTTMVLLLSLLVGGWSQSDTLAQEASPPAGEDMGTGVTFEFLGAAGGVQVPNPADLVAVRFGVDAGSVLPLDERDPTGGLLVVETGSLTVTVEEIWWLTRAEGLDDRLAAAEASGDFATVTEEVSAGEETTLEEGDVAWIPGSVNGEIRNSGEERAEGFIFLVGPSLMAGTPTP
jgi:hypothetical protein